MAADFTSAGRICRAGRNFEPADLHHPRNQFGNVAGFELGHGAAVFGAAECMDLEGGSSI